LTRSFANQVRRWSG